MILEVKDIIDSETGVTISKEGFAKHLASGHLSNVAVIDSLDRYWSMAPVEGQKRATPPRLHRTVYRWLEKQGRPMVAFIHINEIKRLLNETVNVG